MIFYHDFSLTLTTLALYQRSLRWFEVYSYKPTSRGLPSSLITVTHTSLFGKRIRGALHSSKMICFACLSLFSTVLLGY